MSHSPPLSLSPEDKLDVLRYLDEFRFWHALDDERLCERCHQRITGRQVLVFERQGTRGNMRLQCPTAGCASNPSEWIYANPGLAARRQSIPSAPSGKVDVGALSALNVHDGRSSARPRGSRAASRSKRDGVPAGAVNARSLRAFLARLPILRPLATGLHAFRPVA